MTVGVKQYESFSGAAHIFYSDHQIMVTQFGGFNQTETECYPMLFDQETAPADGTPPAMAFRAPAGATFSWEPSMGGRVFSNGLAFAVSSTPDTLTAVAIDCWVYLEGIHQGL
jgi:hypothetical protein